MGTMNSDVSYNLFLHHKPRGGASKRFSSERWYFWQRQCAEYSSRQAYPMRVLRYLAALHQERLDDMIRRGLTVKVIRKHTLDDPFLPEQHWERKIQQRIRVHFKRRGKFSRGHRYFDPRKRSWR